jgi:hypothetical protein
VTGNAPATNSVLTITGVAGNTAANGTWTVTNISPTQFSLNGSNGTSSGPYFNNGLAYVSNYYQAMREIVTYPVMRARNFGVWYKVYSRLGLASYNNTTGLSINQNIAAYYNPKPMTLASARSLYFDYSAPNLFPFWPDMLKAINTGITAGINWLKPYFNQPTASSTYPYVAYPQSTYQANQAAINAALPGIATLLNAFDPTNAYSMTSTGTLMVLAMLYRALDRYNATKQNYVGRATAVNSIFAPLAPNLLNTITIPGYSSDSSLYSFLQSIAVNKFDPLQHVLVNFNRDVNGNYYQVRDLTINDQWQIFINRLTYPNGFNPTQKIDITDPTNALAPQTPQDLIMDALVDALVDIGQLNNSWILSYVNKDNTIKEVPVITSTLLSKASLEWGAVSTLVFPYDYDSTGANLRQYPIPYGQERLWGTQLFQYYDGGNFSIIPPGPVPTGGLGVKQPPAPGANTNFGTGVNNGTTAANRIFNPKYAGNGPNSLYKTGYMKQGGGSAVMRFLEGISECKPIIEHRYSPWGVDGITSFLYRQAIRYLQTGTYPTTIDKTEEEFVFNTGKYNQSTFDKDILAKPGAQKDGLL